MGFYASFMLSTFNTYYAPDSARNKDVADTRMNKIRFQASSGSVWWEDGHVHMITICAKAVLLRHKGGDLTQPSVLEEGFLVIRHYLT